MRRRPPPRAATGGRTTEEHAQIAARVEQEQRDRRAAGQEQVTPVEPAFRKARATVPDDASEGQRWADPAAAPLRSDDPELPPLPAALDGATLLDDVHRFMRRFVAFPSDAARVAATLWAAHTHLLDCFENTARLALLSPEPGSGKTRVMEVLELLVPAPMFVLNASPAAVFRTIDAHRPTLLFDEVDTVFTHRGKDDDHQDLRGLLNSGYRRGAAIPRCVGPRHDVQMFPTFCAVALAGLGDLPDTIMTRSIVIRMRRRAPGEQVEPFRRRLHRDAGHALRDRLTGWATDVEEKLTDTYPPLPDGITDRPADVWEPLLAVADAAGGDWPHRARTACVELVKAAQSIDSGSLGLRLLADLRTIFGDVPHLFTETLLDRLHALDEAPWSDLRGKALDSRGLARRLAPYGVNSIKVRIGEATRKGYRAEDLHDPWQRYLSPVPVEGEQGEHPEQRRSAHPDPVPHEGRQGEHEEHTVPPVPPGHSEGEHNSPLLTCDVPLVPHVPHPAEPERAENGTNGRGADTWRVSGQPITRGGSA